MIDSAKKHIRAQGPCDFCGGPYAYHRVADAQMGRVAAGDSIESVAEEYLTTVIDMVAGWAALADLMLERHLHDERRSTP